jgi:putative NADH-flavin reductase
MEHLMKLTIFAATGGIGRHLLAQAVAAGHDVTAVARHPENLPTELTRADPTGPAVVGTVTTVTADLSRPDPAALDAAVADADAVLSGLGPRTKADAGIASAGTRAIVEALQAAGTRRLVVVSAAPIGTVASADRPAPPRHDPGDGFVMRHVLAPITKKILAEHYADLAEMEDLVRDSGLDWTIVRPPRLTDKPLTARYRTAREQNVRRGLTISRADVAHLMLALVDQPATVKHTIAVAN